jgi:hypothetical protein
LDTRVISIQGISFQKRGFPKFNDFLFDFG